MLGTVVISRCKSSNRALYWIPWIKKEMPRTSQSLIFPPLAQGKGFSSPSSHGFSWLGTPLLGPGLHSAGSPSRPLYREYWRDWVGPRFSPTLVQSLQRVQFPLFPLLSSIFEDKGLSLIGCITPKVCSEDGGGNIIIYVFYTDLIL